jgi:hypothetical protein
LLPELELSDLAPISVTVYNRVHHFKQCIDSLKKNSLSRYSVLYVFSDCAKEGDEEQVAMVRKYCKTITGFKRVVLCFQSENNHRKNSQDARDLPLNKHGKSIRMEDDIVVGPSFLEFINQGLVYYRDWESILSISGYCPPIVQDRHIDGDVYLSKYFSAWGHGVWKDKAYLGFLKEERPYQDMLNSGLLKEVKKVHPKLPLALKRMDEGMHRAGDQKLTYFMIKNNMYQIKPRHSLVRNTGFDGTGVHCGASKKFDTPVFDDRLDVRIRSKRYIDRFDKLQYEFFYGSRNHFVRIGKKIIRKLNVSNDLK